jgi:hypothetical protein
MSLAYCFAFLSNQESFAIYLRWQAPRALGHSIQTTAPIVARSVTATNREQRWPGALDRRRAGVCKEAGHRLEIRKKKCTRGMQIPVITCLHHPYVRSTWCASRTPTEAAQDFLRGRPPWFRSLPVLPCLRFHLTDAGVNRFSAQVVGEAQRGAAPVMEHAPEHCEVWYPKVENDSFAEGRRL